MCENPFYVKIQESNRKYKKMKATFYDKDKKQCKSIHFGDNRYDDYTVHKDEKRKESFLKRFNKTKKYDTPYELSKQILWNKKSKIASINDYIKKNKLKKIK